MKQKQIIFKNRKYLLIGDKKHGGAICTKKQFENGYMSFAHLEPDGNIYRFNVIIGNVKDIKMDKWIQVNPKIFTGMMNMLTGWF